MAVAAMAPSGRGDLAVYRRFLPLLRPHRRRLALAVAAASCGPLLAASRIWLLKTLIDTVLRGHRPGLLPLVAGTFIAISAVRGLLTYLDEKVSGGVGTQVVHELRTTVYSHLQGLSLRYYHRQRLGDLLTRLSGDIAAIEDLLVSGLTVLVSHLVTVVLFLVLLVYLDPALVLVAAGVVPVLVLITVVEARRGRRAQRTIRQRASELTSVAEEGLSAIALVKAYARGGHETSRFSAASRSSASARLRLVGLRAVFPPLSDLVTGAGTATVVFVGAQQVLAGRLSVGSLVVFISYLASLYVPIQGLGRLTGTVQRALVGAERVAEILATPAGLTEPVGLPELPTIKGHVQLQHVTFGYRPDRPVLHDVTLEIRPGQMLALIGASGAGKTTVVSLLCNYYDTDTGQVLLDGHPLHHFDRDSSRRQVAAVLQEPMLFNASIRDNIRYGRLDATDAEVTNAAEVAQAAHFVNDLPEGYDTIIGPRGSALSGGQRQRLAIARAILKSAPVLILDEATSALDPATEARVLSALRAACTHTAVLLVAHRYSTIRHADRVAVLDNGRITEQGTPAELTARGGAYRDFIRNQSLAVSGS